MDALKKGWFCEVNDLWPGVCPSYEIDAILHAEKSKFQDILVLRTKHHGVLLILDDVMQFLEDDEFTYNEMVTFLPLCSHPNPKKVLIIGGGSGGAVKQVIKHPTVESVDLVEIDRRVVEVCKRFLPSNTAVYDDPKVNVFIEDGLDFIKRNENKYDVIITDSSDPVGPSTNLYEENYFELMKKALRPGGIMSMQAGSLWLASKNTGRSLLPSHTYKVCQKIFGNAAYATISVPCFPSGQIGVVVASANQEVDLKKPVFTLKEEFLEKRDIRYYSPSIHSAAFVIPRHFEKLFK